MTRTFLCALAALAACGDNDPPLYDHDPGSFSTVTVWVDPHPDVPPETAREACEAWYPEGVLCELAPSSEEALIRIRPLTGACEKTEDGSYVLGIAWEGGEIALVIECLRKFGGTPIGVDILWPVIAHEVGHQLGIWTHVDPEKGFALMNPKVHEGLFGITPLDHEAFLARDEDHGVLRSAPGGCVLTFRE